MKFHITEIREVNGVNRTGAACEKTINKTFNGLSNSDFKKFCTLFPDKICKKCKQIFDNSQN